MTLRDSRQVRDGTVLRTDVCVVGGGAAGTTVALELARNRIPTVVVESGGLELKHATQALYKGEVTGSLHGSEYLTATRLRQLGGSTHHWARKIIPLSPVDFRARAWVPNSGWP